MNENYVYAISYFGRLYWTDNYWAKFIFVPIELYYSVPAEQIEYTIPKEESTYTVPAYDLTYNVSKPK